MADIKEIIRDRLRNYAVAVLVMIVIALLSIIVLILDCPEWVDVIANSTLGAVIGASLVDLACSVAAGKEAEDDMRKGIMETLCPGKTGVEKPELYSLYKRDAIEPILHQCLSAYCAAPQLSAGYLSYIKDSCRHLKKDEVYKVTVQREHNGTLSLMQSLKQTAIFRPEPGEKPYFQAYFIFKDRAELSDHKGTLDKVMNDKSYFFREDLVDDTFVQDLIDAKHKAEASGTPLADVVFPMLEFSVDLFKTGKADDKGRRIADQVYQVEFDFDMIETNVRGQKEKNYYGLRIKTFIPEEFIMASDQFFKEEGFVQFTACMNTKYRIPSSQNTFYVIYAIPTFNPYFEIKFKMGTSDFADRVDYMPFMSIDKSAVQNNEYDGIIQNHGSSLSFASSRTVFPRSGISFTWNGMNV